MTVFDDQPAAPRPLFGFGSILLAGFIGGPLAGGVLAFHNVRRGAPGRPRNILLAFFVATSLIWLWCISHVPPDLISHLLVHVPLWIVSA
nr:hypothetical protein [uncultured Roseateles sp.]